VSQKRHLCSTL